MQLVLTRNLWGLADDPAQYAEALTGVAAAGYDAVACPVQLIPDKARFADALAASGLEYIPQAFSFGATYDDHLTMFEQAIRAAAEFSPRHVICQAGPDGWSTDDALRFLRDALKIGEAVGVTCAHETHRGRILYSPWVARPLIEALPELRLACDLSHWVCVTERAAMSEALLTLLGSRALHIDARVGHEEGPQVPDPRSPRYEKHLQLHEQWWRTIWDARDAAGQAALTVAPEFGPPPYQPVDPWTGEPLADVNELNDWMAARVKERFRPVVTVPS